MSKSVLELWQTGIASTNASKHHSMTALATLATDDGANRPVIACIELVKVSSGA
jgi:hypothetical protein